jgi:Reverse transcriptase (RNA-dependent DNA polymerase)
MAQQPDAQHDQLLQIRQWVTEGVTLDFISTPSPIDHTNTLSVIQNADIVRSRLQQYIEFQAVIELPSNHPCPFGIQPLHVIIKPNKKPRLVIDLSRNLNDNLTYEYFRYSSVWDATELSTPNCWYGKLDLSNCFLSFPLHPSAFPHFIFRFDDKLYQFTRMPFGLSSAPRICTLLLSVVAYRLKQHLTETALIRYLDDFLFITLSRQYMSIVLTSAQQIISDFGLVVNPDKTEGPAQQLSFLGIQLDSVTQTLSCTNERIAELQQLLTDAVSLPKLKLSALASLIGKLGFAATVLPGARPFLRRMLNLKQLHEDRLHKKYGSGTSRHTAGTKQHYTSPIKTHPVQSGPQPAQAGTTLVLNTREYLYSSIHPVDYYRRSSSGIKHTRSSYTSTEKSPARLRFALQHARVYHDRGFRDDAQFWQTHLSHWNGRARWRSAYDDPFIFASDASQEGFGFYIETIPEQSQPHTSTWPTHMLVGSGYSGVYSPGHKPLHESSSQMTWCEMFAVYTALVTYCKLLSNSCVLFFIDNKTDVDILNKQATRSARLSGLLREIYTLTLQYNISIRARHRKGVDNTLADFLSRPSLHHSHNIVQTWRKTNKSLSHMLSSVSIIHSSAYVNKLVLPQWMCSSASHSEATQRKPTLLTRRLSLTFASDSTSTTRVR